MAVAANCPGLVAVRDEPLANRKFGLLNDREDGSPSVKQTKHLERPKIP